MGDRCYARIMIGGEVLPEFQEIIADAIHTEFLQHGSHKNLRTLKAIAKQFTNSDGVLEFEDDEVNYGNFEDLESALQNADVAYDKYNGEGGGYGAGWLYFRPGADPAITGHECTHEGRAVRLHEIEKVIDLIKIGTIPWQQARKDAVAALEKLIYVPPLPPLRVR